MRITTSPRRAEDLTTGTMDRQDSLNFLDQMHSEDHQVADMDPLACDEFFAADFHALIGAPTPAALINATIECSRRVFRLRHLSHAQTLACLRDLGMMAAALTRIGVELSSVGGLENTLVRLGRSVNEVPRDTVFSYGPRNPLDARMRTFTSIPEERVFIESFRSGMSLNLSCIQHLLNAIDTELALPRFAYEVKLAEKAFSQMITAMVQVKSQISPEVFSHHLRPFFDPITICGTTYLAPGGAQMPILIIDRLVWANEIRDKMYKDYYTENLAYLPPPYRELASTLVPEEYLLGRLLNESRNSKYTRHCLAAFRAVDSFLAALNKFRFPHLRVAQANMKVRPAGMVGSGGYRTEILQYLIEKTAKSRSTVQMLEARYG